MRMGINQAWQQGLPCTINDGGTSRKSQITPKGHNGALLYDEGVSRKHTSNIEDAYMLKNGWMCHFVFLSRSLILCLRTVHLIASRSLSRGFANRYFCFYSPFLACCIARQTFSGFRGMSSLFSLPTEGMRDGRSPPRRFLLQYILFHPWWCPAGAWRFGRNLGRLNVKLAKM